ncbi:hypothetical protein V2J09_024258 [Rumex salicifolius]
MNRLSCCCPGKTGDEQSPIGNKSILNNKRSVKKSIKDYLHSRSRASSFANISLKSESSRHRYITEEIAKYGKGSIPAHVFKFRDLCTATKNFSNETLLGEGGFGRVYRGYVESIKQEVAIKQLDRNGFQGNKEFLVEVLMLSLLHHSNLVNLVGYCCEGDQRILVYEFMHKGSLEEHLLDLAPGKEPLEWTTRMKIAEDAARGLEYLHETAEPPVIYRDFKASNVLLDDNFNAKLSDFGLAKLGPTGEQTHVSTRVMGTYGYCAPEYAATGQLTTKSDVYSFGVVFLELITGRRVIDNNRPSEEQNLVVWAQPLLKDKSKFILMADPLLQGNFPKKGLYQALAVAAMCLQQEASTRPFISDVVTALEFLSSNKSLKADDHDHGAEVEAETEEQELDGEQTENIIFCNFCFVEKRKGRLFFSSIKSPPPSQCQILSKFQKAKSEVLGLGFGKLKMDGEMEKSDVHLPRRKLVLRGSAALLLMSLFLAIVFNTLFESPWLNVAALLVLGAQTALSLFCFDAIHTSILVERESVVLDLLSMILHPDSPKSLGWDVRNWGGFGLLYPSRQNALYSCRVLCDHYDETARFAALRLANSDPYFSRDRDDNLEA